MAAERKAREEAERKAAAEAKAREELLAKAKAEAEKKGPIHNRGNTEKPTYLTPTDYSPLKLPEGTDRVFELRIYHVAPGKMKQLHGRFRDHTCKLFTRHGLSIIGFWSPEDEKEAEKTMYYVLAYPSKEAADKSWKAFREDPDWVKAKAASEKDGTLVAKIESGWIGS